MPTKQNTKCLKFLHQTSKKGLRQLKNEGFVKNVEFIEDDKQGIIRVFLKYGTNGERVITNLKRVSKPGLRVYFKREDIPKVLNGTWYCNHLYSGRSLTDKEVFVKRMLVERLLPTVIF